MHGMLYRHTRTALVVIAATFCGATSERVHAQPVGEIAERRSDLDDLKKRIRDLEQEMARTEASRSSATKSLADAERAVSRVVRELAKLEAERRDAENKLALLEAGMQGEAVAARVVKDGKTTAFGLAAAVPQGVVYVRLPLAQLTSGFDGVAMPAGGYLALRQGAFSVRERGNAGLQDVAERMAHTVGKTGLRVATAVPDSEPGPLGLGAIPALVAAGLLAALAALALLVARGGIRLPRIGKKGALMDETDEPTLGEALRRIGEGAAMLVLDAGTGIRRLGTTIPDGVRRIDILLTHLHMDHIGGLLVDGVKEQLHPELRIHVAAAEVEFWKAPDFTRTNMPPGFPDALRATATHFLAEYGSYVRTFDEVHEIAPGVTAHRTGGHTCGGFTRT